MVSPQESSMNLSPPKTRSLAGPLILITIGALFLLHNLSHINVFRLFWRYWPVLLIAIGIGKLLQYFRNDKIPSS